MKKEAPNFYKNLIRRAWTITKNHKYLWFFGFFSAILVGAAGEYNILVKNIDKISDKTSVFYGFEDSFFSQGYFTDIYYRFISLSEWMGPFVFWPILVLFVLLGLYALWVILISEPSIISATNKLDTKKKTSFSESFAEGKKNLLPSVVLNFIGKILVWVAFVAAEVLLGYLFYTTANYSWVVIYLIISFLILLPLAIIISFVTKFALAYVVLKGEKIFSALKKGWQLFFKNWLANLELALIIFVIYFFVGIILFVILALITLPLFLLMAVGITAGASLLSWFVFVLDIVIFFVSIVLVGSIMASWQLTSWVLMFDHLVNDSVKSGIVESVEQAVKNRPFQKKKSIK